LVETEKRFPSSFALEICEVKDPSWCYSHPENYFAKANTESQVMWSSHGYGLWKVLLTSH